MLPTRVDAHDVKATTAVGPYPRSVSYAYCSCGWEGPTRKTRAEADHDAAEHRFQTNQEERSCHVCGASPSGRCDPPDDYEGECPHGCSPER